MRILLLSPYPPDPPHGGGTMRIFQIARGLAHHHDLTCLTFAPDAAAAAMPALRACCRVEVVIGPPQRSLPQRAWTTLASPLPDMALRNASPEYSRALRQLLDREWFDVIQAESIEMAPYLLAVANYYRGASKRPRLILDQFNAEYLLQKRAALTSLRSALRAHSPKRFVRDLAGGIYSLAQWLKLAAFERRAMQGCNGVAAVSEDDAQILATLAPTTPIAVVPNGVDTSSFDRRQLTVHKEADQSPTVVFSGTLDFRANIDAITWFVGEVWPLVRARRPTARLLVVGKRPAPALQALAAAGALTLTGEVPDARPYMANAAAYIVPMRIGGGVRLKLLEALALEAPVVSTSMGAEGIAGLNNGQHCLLADTPEQFAEATLRLIDDQALGQQLGQQGRLLVQHGYDWESIIPRMEAIYLR
ncbi:MAG: glycosyltransferase [Roseiflexaceae bacterium]